ncbi:hypothetical protein QBC37DRAFT_380131 [Rhypophila decipiens]|uniref:Uncharacterized protein n=1 Tax=Rhypophila decipiens TaxID=261697 RepID=A0AAN6XVD6_9PEZI|nr:hypothetical protein QBC37DRAFT_380131 [Rhypophila decipiens]
MEVSKAPDSAATDAGGRSIFDPTCPIIAAINRAVFLRQISLLPIPVLLRPRTGGGVSNKLGHRQFGLTIRLAKDYISKDPANRLPMIGAGKLKDLVSVLALDEQTLADLWENEGDEYYHWRMASKVKAVSGASSLTREQPAKQPRMTISKPDAATAKEKPTRQPNGPKCDTSPGFNSGAAVSRVQQNGSTEPATDHGTKKPVDPPAQEARLQTGCVPSTETDGDAPLTSGPDTTEQKGQIAADDDNLNMWDIVVISEGDDMDWVVVGECDF